MRVSVLLVLAFFAGLGGGCQLADDGMANLAADSKPPQARGRKERRVNTSEPAPHTDSGSNCPTCPPAPWGCRARTPVPTTHALQDYFKPDDPGEQHRVFKSNPASLGLPKFEPPNVLTLPETALPPPFDSQ